MSFQTHINSAPPPSKQKMHQIGYTANGFNYNEMVETSHIVDEISAINISKIMSILLSKHPAGTNIVLQTILDKGLQNVEVP